MEFAKGLFHLLNLSNPGISGMPSLATAKQAYTARFYRPCLRKMEERVWSDPSILSILKNDVVLISLYVDDKRKLPKGEEVISELTGKQLKYIGQKWSEFQTIKYKANAQPFYVLIDLQENNLEDPVGYTPDIEEYHHWLEKGIQEFKKNR